MPPLEEDREWSTPSGAITGHASALADRPVAACRRVRRARRRNLADDRGSGRHPAPATGHLWKNGLALASRLLGCADHRTDTDSHTDSHTDSDNTDSDYRSARAQPQHLRAGLAGPWI